MAGGSFFLPVFLKLFFDLLSKLLLLRYNFPLARCDKLVGEDKHIIALLRDRVQAHPLALRHESPEEHSPEALEEAGPADDVSGGNGIRTILFGNFRIATHLVCIFYQAVQILLDFFGKWPNIKHMLSGVVLRYEHVNIVKSHFYVLLYFNILFMGMRNSIQNFLITYYYTILCKISQIYTSIIVRQKMLKIDCSTYYSCIIFKFRSYNFRFT